MKVQFSGIVIGGTTMNFKEQYEQIIQRQRLEVERYRRAYDKLQEQHVAERPDFERLCERLSDQRRNELFEQVYKERVSAGLEPFTFCYDYECTKNAWLAKRTFKCIGRYNPDGNDIIFVPEGIEITGGDHTIILYLGRPEKNDFVPAYQDTV